MVTAVPFTSLHQFYLNTKRNEVLIYSTTWMNFENLQNDMICVKHLALTGTQAGLINGGIVKKNSIIIVTFSKGENVYERTSLTVSSPCQTP